MLNDLLGMEGQSGVGLAGLYSGVYFSPVICANDKGSKLGKGFDRWIKGVNPTKVET